MYRWVHLGGLQDQEIRPVGCESRKVVDSASSGLGVLLEGDWKEEEGWDLRCLSWQK
jgi:hypothetical protein